MCGLFGVAGKMKQKRTFMSVAAILNESRGAHSTGIGRVNNDCHAVCKSAVEASRFIQYAKYQEFVSKPSQVLLGHCRWATKGEISNKNAHPFRDGSTMGTHNGTVLNVKQLKKKTKMNFAVDSQYLVHLIEKKGNIDDAWGSTNMAYCKKGDSADLRLIRNGKSLVLAWDRKNCWVAYSSQESHLKTALSVSGENDYDLWCMKDRSTTSVFLDKNGCVDDIIDKELNSYVFEDVVDSYVSSPAKSSYGGGDDWEDYRTWWDRQADRSLDGYECLDCDSVGHLMLEPNDNVVCNFCTAEYPLTRYTNIYGKDCYA